MLADNDAVRTTLISGEPEICRAFLFESAIAWAKEGQQVYYFASKQFESLPLSFHDRSEPSADALKLITFIYPPSYESLASQLVRLPSFQRTASVLLLDDLDIFASGGPLKAARCCAVLLNAARACSGRLERAVRVCAAGPARPIYRLYFDSCWELEQSASEESRSLWLREPGRALEFSRLDDPVLVLRAIYAEDANDDA